MLFFVPDPHFRHPALARSGARPEDFEDRIKSSWKESVRPDDTVIVLGDVSFAAAGDTISSLPGKKILVRGNHDHGSDAKFRGMGFDVVCDEMQVRMRGRRILLTHCPMYGHACDINIHGHLHDLFSYPGPGLRLPLALEVSDYAPITADERFEKSVERFCRRFEERGIRPSTEDIASLHRPGRKLPLNLDADGFLRITDEDDETFARRTGCQRREEKLMAMIGPRPRRLVDLARTFLNSEASKASSDREAWAGLMTKLGMNNVSTWEN